MTRRGLFGLVAAAIGGRRAVPAAPRLNRRYLWITWELYHAHGCPVAMLDWDSEWHLTLINWQDWNRHLLDRLAHPWPSRGEPGT